MLYIGHGTGSNMLEGPCYGGMPAIESYAMPYALPESVLVIMTKMSPALVRPTKSLPSTQQRHSPTSQSSTCGLTMHLATRYHHGAA